MDVYWTLGFGGGGGLLLGFMFSSGVKEGVGKQEGEEQRPTEGSKKETLRARGLRHGGLAPLPAVAQHSLPPSPQDRVGLSVWRGVKGWRFVWSGRVFGLVLDVDSGAGVGGLHSNGYARDAIGVHRYVHRGASRCGKRCVNRFVIDL